MLDSELFALIDEPALRREVSAVALAEAFLARIERHRGRIDAVLTPLPDAALADARGADAARAAGSPLPLDGLPLVVKDNIDVAGVRGTCGSAFFEHRIAERDAEVVTRLRAAGAVIVGKAQSTELMFALRSHSLYPRCRNPWDADRIPGASSSGSGAALGADECIAALGTDTGGSVRNPASFSGVAGLRPTFGLVSTDGVVPLSRSLDTVGPMARSVEDVAAVLAAVAGYDAKDGRSLPAAVPPDLAQLHAGVRGLRIGVPVDFFFVDIDPSIERAVREAIAVLVELGAEVREVRVPGAEAAWRAFTSLVRIEALSLHRERLRDRPDLFEVDVRDRLRLGEQVSGADAALLYEHLHVWRREVELLFQDGLDVIASPTVPLPAPTLEAARLGRLGDVTRLTYPWSYASVPALSLPCGLDAEGLPVGLQLAAARLRDDVLLRAGAAYQHVTDWHRRRPPLD